MSIRQNVTASYAVRVTNSAVQALVSNSAFTWNTVDHEVGNATLWDAGQPTRLVAPCVGTYIINACIAAETDATTSITIRKNGNAGGRNNIGWLGWVCRIRMGVELNALKGTILWH